PLLDGVNDAYRSRGHKLQWHPSNSKEGRQILDKDPCVYVTTPSDKHHLGRRHSRAYATGWALSLKRRTTAFPLSSHADFHQLVSFIKACNPRKVYIFTGLADQLRRALKTRLGLEARVVPSYVQRTLSEDY
ncbi:MAG TPA: MBL fold metallo-hydrolase RNA specificity domain-containing protein, partial [Candidatus Bathyarchaeia archaeon]|nr:MBL fold metallo-hydrolase RNA specificity domain-containing protein [Candidatus Bathyarchaeia archaeon]